MRKQPEVLRGLAMSPQMRVVGIHYMWSYSVIPSSSLNNPLYDYETINVSIKKVSKKIQLMVTIFGDYYERKT